jgi:hypothetical protein
VRLQSRQLRSLTAFFPDALDALGSVDVPTIRLVGPVCAGPWRRKERADVLDRSLSGPSGGVSRTLEAKTGVPRRA